MWYHRETHVLNGIERHASIVVKYLNSLHSKSNLKMESLNSNNINNLDITIIINGTNSINIQETNPNIPDYSIIPVISNQLHNKNSSINIISQQNCKF